VLLNREGILVRVADGKSLTQEKVKEFDNIIVFTEDYSETFVCTGNEEFGPYYKSAEMAVADGSEPIEPEDTAEPEEE